MRISDWSSDVCSSDLCGWLRPGHGLPSRCRCSWRGSCLGLRVRWPVPRPPLRAARRLRLVSTATVTPPAGVVDPNPGNNSSTARLVVVQQNDGAGCNAGNERSEEHTSELQSLMRISYAVFCLKKHNK